MIIISTEEFKEMGFTCDAANEQLLENCIKRAGYILNAMCGGTLASAMSQCESNAALIKQAAAFEADALLKEELSSGGTSRVAIGDVSYSETETSRESAQSAPKTVKNLLRAAGCFSSAGAPAEVIE